MAELMRCSVKQLKMAWNCPRQWVGHYIHKLPTVEGEALAVGNKVHAACSQLVEGRPLTCGPESAEGKMARALMDELPPHTKAVSEIIKQVQLPEYGLAVDLRCDWMSQPWFLDFKTTGAPSPTAKLPNGNLWALDDLTNDWQANIYAFLLMREHWRVPVVNARWAFVSKKFKEGKAPRTWHVDHTFHYEPTRLWFETYVLPTADLIRELRDAKPSLREAPHNPASCEFKGLFCDIAGHCGFRSSPVMSYNDLHLPVINTKGTK